MGATIDALLLSFWYLVGQCDWLLFNRLLLEYSGSLYFSINTRAFLFTGLFGGFTTFSSFALDTMVLMRTGEYKMALLNVLASNILGLIAVFLGIILGKNIIAMIK